MEYMNQKQLQQQQQQQQQHEQQYNYPTELTSFANPNNAVIQHIDWIIEINFEEQIIISKAIYTIRVNNNNTTTRSTSTTTSNTNTNTKLNDNDTSTNVILDTSNLFIKSVQGVVEQVQVQGVPVVTKDSEDYERNSTTCTKTTFIDLPYTLDDCIPNKIHLGHKLTIDVSKLVQVPVVHADNNSTASSTQQHEQDQEQQHDSIIIKIQIEYETKKQTSTTANTTPVSELSESSESASSVSSSCGAIQWLTCNQTIDKLYPFMFTQCFPIHARSLVPCQDMPCVKFTYTATVTVPIWSHPVLSAIDITSSSKASSSLSSTKSKIVKAQQQQQQQQQQHTFYFEQTIPMSSYLLAIACGQLQKRTISSRCDVYSEPSIIDSVHFEFQPVEQFLQIAESIVCPNPSPSTATGTSVSNSESNDDNNETINTNTNYVYVWKRYDIICLPYSFPYGGAENPCMTFITPTLITGTSERPLVDVVAHEIAHSWTGNLITCNTWNDFWLNEGWTMWFQRNIMKQKYILSKSTKSTASTMDEQYEKHQYEQHEHEQYSQLLYDFDSLCGYEELCETIRTVSNENSKLILNIDDNDPDEYYSRIAYEKGYYFLSYLESLVGKEQFLLFFQYYIKTFSTIGTISSNEFRTCFMNYFSSSSSITTSTSTNINDIDWDVWYNKPGLPSITIQYDTTLAIQSESLANEWITYNKNTQYNNRNEHASTGTTNMTEQQQEQHIPTTCIQDWTSNQIIYFLDKLISKTIASADVSSSTGSSPDFLMLQSKTIQLMDEQYNLSITKDSEILYRFCRIVIDCNVYEYWYNTVIPFITSQGRMKYIRPLYRALYNNTNVSATNNINNITPITTLGSTSTTPDDSTTTTSTDTGNAPTNGMINGRTLAIELYNQYKSFYHPICSKMIASDLHINL